MPWLVPSIVPREVDAIAIAVGHHPAPATLMTAVVALHAVADHPLQAPLHLLHLVGMQLIVPVEATLTLIMGVRSSILMVGQSMVVAVSAPRPHSIWLAVSWSSIWICPMHMEM